MPPTSAGVWTAGMPFTVCPDMIASDRIVRFRPALAYASPEMVSLAPGLTVVALRPIVNGALTFAGTAFAGTAAPPDVAASAAGAPARAVAAIAPTAASLRDEGHAVLGNIGISIRVRGERLGGRRLSGAPDNPSGAAHRRPYPATTLRLRHY